MGIGSTTNDNKYLRSNDIYLIDRNVDVVHQNNDNQATKKNETVIFFFLNLELR